MKATAVGVTLVLVGLYLNLNDRIERSKKRRNVEAKIWNLNDRIERFLWFRVNKFWGFIFESKR